MVNLIWGSSFKRAYRKVAVANPDLKPKISQALETFTDNPLSPLLRTHKLERLAKDKYPNNIVLRGRTLIESELNSRSGVAKLNEFAALTRQGMKVTEASRTIGITPEYASRALKRNLVELLSEKLVLKLH